MIEKRLTEKILTTIAERRGQFSGSDSKFATSLGISAAQYSRISRGDVDKVLSDANWISIARKLGVELREVSPWNIVKTPTFEFITAQLELCQQGSIGGMLCELSDIGKSYTAVHYCKTHRNAVYVDCSQVKRRSALIRKIAREFGVGSTGRYADVYEDLVYYLKTLDNPIIILDEAGDLCYEAFLEIKALWNATENICGWYMMGADGLGEKIRRSIEYHKVGYSEIFSRFGKRYGTGTVIPNGEEGKQIAMQQAYLIAKGNAPEGYSDADIKTIVRRCVGDDGMPSLRRIYREIRKIVK